MPAVTSVHRNSSFPQVVNKVRMAWVQKIRPRRSPSQRYDVHLIRIDNTEIEIELGELIRHVGSSSDSYLVYSSYRLWVSLRTLDSE